MVPDFQRYLAAKTTVDDRALNRTVWDEMARKLPPSPAVLEIACGVGTMYRRMHTWGLATAGFNYRGVDADCESIWAAKAAEFPGSPKFECSDLFDLKPSADYDLLVAAAFLDLMPLDGVLPRLSEFLKPGGLAYFPINFDGLTAFEPVYPSDAQILQAYHDSMDQRVSGGHSLTGRMLFQALPQSGFNILSAGASDWLVFPDAANRYPADEAYFLHHILYFFETSCAGTPGLRDWLAVRRSQVDTGQLVFIAHQYDFLVQRRAA